MSAVLVTGGGTGIGAAVARALRAAGDEVAILGRRPEVLAAVAGAVALVVERFGRLDGLVLNAGVMVPEGFPGCRRPTGTRWSR